MIGKIILGGGAKLGQLLGGKVARDLEYNAVKNAEKLADWTHEVKIQELAEDSYLAPDYLQGLIEHSWDKHDLRTIAGYLQNETKTGNLSPQRLASLVRMAKDKFEVLTIKDIIREYGDSLF